MPSGGIDDHDGVDVVGKRGGEMGEEQRHRGRVDEGEHQGEVLAAGGMRGREDIGPLVADLPRRPGSFAPTPPSMTDQPLVAATSLVLEPEFDPLPGMRGSNVLQAFAEPPFLKLSSACASFLGCEGRIFRLDRFRLLGTRLIEEGW